MDMQIIGVHHVTDEVFRSGCHGIIYEGYKIFDKSRFYTVLLYLWDLDWTRREYDCQTVEGACTRARREFNNLYKRGFRHGGVIFFADNEEEGLEHAL